MLEIHVVVQDCTQLKSMITVCVHVFHMTVKPHDGWSKSFNTPVGHEKFAVLTVWPYSRCRVKFDYRSILNDVFEKEIIIAKFD